MRCGFLSSHDRDADKPGDDGGSLPKGENVPESPIGQNPMWSGARIRGECWHSKAHLVRLWLIDIADGDRLLAGFLCALAGRKPRSSFLGGRPQAGWGSGGGEAGNRPGRRPAAFLVRQR